MKEMLEDLIDLIVETAEKTVNMILVLLVIIGFAGLFIDFEGLFIIPPLVSSIYFVGSIIYKYFRKTFQETKRKLYFIIIYPPYVFLSLIGYGLFETNLRFLLLIFIGSVMMVVFIAKIYANSREYDVVF
ncbi:MAG: hypothetical protein DRJ35_00490 [Thermoprotei archaeon]|nr:MAG: hypothetical protein DRJ35_00490 [Thermoprotei archaeon]